MAQPGPRTSTSLTFTPGAVAQHEVSAASVESSGRVFKGKKLPGHMGVQKITIQNLEIIKVDMDKNVLLVKGSVPGPKGAILKLKSSVKSCK